MKSIVPLSLAVSALALIALIVMQTRLADTVREIPKTATHDVRIMEPPKICLTKTWCSSECGEVVVETCFRETGHETESHKEFVTRHKAAIAAMMKECPEDC